MTPPTEGQDMLLTAINAKIEPIARQLERMEERMENRTSNLVTRSDLEALRRELVTRDAFEPQLNALKAQISRAEADRIEDKRVLEKRIEEMELEQLTKQDRLWIRLAQAGGLLGLALAVFDFLSHIKFLP